MAEGGLYGRVGCMAEGGLYGRVGCMAGRGCCAASTGRGLLPYVIAGRRLSG
jgi:hypothetical protein